MVKRMKPAIIIHSARRRSLGSARYHVFGFFIFISYLLLALSRSMAVGARFELAVRFPVHLLSKQTH